MSAQQAIMPVTTAIDVRRFVRFEAIEDGRQVFVGGMGGKRSQEQGTTIGIISLKKAGSYEVLVQFADGKIESFTPMSLFPVTEEHRDD
jgi:hypothetical protein